TRDDRDAGGGGERNVAKILALVDVGNVHFHGGQMGAKEGVAQRDARVGEGAAVDDEAVEFRVGEGGEFVDEFALVVRLKELQPGFRAKFRAQRGLEVGERGAAVNLRLAFAEAVKVGTVENGDLLH